MSFNACAHRQAHRLEVNLHDVWEAAAQGFKYGHLPVPGNMWS